MASALTARDYKNTGFGAAIFLGFYIYLYNDDQPKYWGGGRSPCPPIIYAPVIVAYEFLNKQARYLLIKFNEALSI